MKDFIAGLREKITIKFSSFSFHIHVRIELWKETLQKSFNVEKLYSYDLIFIGILKRQTIHLSNMEGYFYSVNA